MFGLFPGLTARDTWLALVVNGGGAGADRRGAARAAAPSSCRLFVCGKLASVRFSFDRRLVASG
jgi:hypothetical protein